MRTVILAAGEGIRMRPLTQNKPKPLLEVLGKPLLRYSFEALPDAVTEVILVVGYLGDQIREYCGNEFLGRKIHYVKQKEKRGTAHGLWICREFLGSERFLTFYADDIQQKSDLEACLKYPLAISVSTVSDPRKFGVVSVDKNMRVLDLAEKPEIPPSNFVSTGIKVLDERIFKYFSPHRENGEHYITDPLRDLAQNYEVIAVPASGWIPIGYPEDLKKAEKIMRKLNTR